MGDVILAYRQLVKLLEIGENFRVEFKSHRFTFDIEFWDKKGDSYDFSTGYRIDASDVESDIGCAIINFTRLLRDHFKKTLYGVFDYTYSDEFIRNETEDRHYDKYGNEQED